RGALLHSPRVHRPHRGRAARRPGALSIRGFVLRSAWILRSRPRRTRPESFCTCRAIRRSRLLRLSEPLRVSKKPADARDIRNARRLLHLVLSRRAREEPPAGDPGADKRARLSARARGPRAENNK